MTSPRRPLSVFTFPAPQGCDLASETPAQLGPGWLAASPAQGLASQQGDSSGWDESGARAPPHPCASVAVPKPHPSPARTQARCSEAHLRKSEVGELFPENSFWKYKQRCSPRPVHSVSSAGQGLQCLHRRGLRPAHLEAQLGLGWAADQGLEGEGRTPQAVGVPRGGATPAPRGPSTPQRLPHHVWGFIDTPGAGDKPHLMSEQIHS